MSGIKKRIAIIGATSAIAEQCARLWAMETQADFFLVGRNIAKLELVAADLRVRSPGTTINCIDCDFLNPKSIQDLADQICGSGTIDIVLIAQGMLPDQYHCQKDLVHCCEALEINGISPVLFAEAFAIHMESENKGVIAIIGSVAGDRTRRSNYIYGSAKAFIASYADGLKHRLIKTNVRVILIKPGPTDTPMTAHLKNRGISLSLVSDVAKTIVDGISKERLIIYAPSRWYFIMMIIRNIPNFIFNKLNI